MANIVLVHQSHSLSSAHVPFLENQGASTARFFGLVRDKVAVNPNPACFGRHTYCNRQSLLFVLLHTSGSIEHVRGLEHNRIRCGT